MTDKNACMCSGAPKLVFACSGAADVGEIADHAARELTASGIGKMYCLNGIGGGVSGIIETTRSAAKIIAIDGCPVDCAKKTLEAKGFDSFEHIRVTDLGLLKGQAPASEENVDTVVEKVKKALACQ